MLSQCLHCLAVGLVGAPNDHFEPVRALILGEYPCAFKVHVQTPPAECDYFPTILRWKEWLPDRLNRSPRHAARLFFGATFIHSAPKCRLKGRGFDPPAPDLNSLVGAFFRLRHRWRRPGT